MPDNPLDSDTVYTAEVVNVEDLAGNAIVTPIQWILTTGSTLDLVPPAITDRYPAPGTEGVVTGTKVKAAFSEPVNPDTVNTSTFVVTGPSGQVGGNFSFFSFPGGNTAVFTPTMPLDENVSYTVTIQNVEDLAGNPMSAPDIWDFSTGVYVWDPNPPEEGDWGFGNDQGSLGWGDDCDDPADPGNPILCIDPTGGQDGKNQEAYAVSEIIDIGELNELLLSFDHMYDIQFNPNHSDIGLVQISTCDNSSPGGCGEPPTNWSAFQTGYISYPDDLAEYQGQSGGSYVPALVDFSSFISDGDYSIRVRFFFDLDGKQPSGGGWWIKNIHLTGG